MIKKFLVLTIFVAGVFAPAAMAESEDVRYWEPDSTIEASSGTQFFESEDAVVVRHTNVTTDDTQGNILVPVLEQEKAEFNTGTSVTVMGNMGSSSGAKIYTSDGLESKTGQPVQKKGVVQVPYGKSVKFTTTGSEIVDTETRSSSYFRLKKQVDAKARAEAEEKDAAEGEPEAEEAKSNRPRVLVS